MLIRDSRNLKKLKAVRRAEFTLKQRLERIDWEEDVLLPELNDFLGRAALPKPPDERIVDIEFVRATARKKPRAKKQASA